MNGINHSSRFIEEFNNPEIPKVSMSELCATFIDGDWIEAKDQSDSGYRLVQTGNVGVCEYVDKEEHARFISEDTFKRLNCTEIRSGDILFSRLPDPIGRCCMIPQGFQKAITAVDCTITRLKDKCLPEYLMVYTTTTMYSEQIKTCITGTTRQRISRGNLAKIQVPLPTTDHQQSFVDLVHQADKSKFNGFKSRFIEQFSKYGQSRKLGDVVKLMDDRRKPINDAERQSMKTGELYPYYGATGQVDSINSYLTDDTLLCIAEDCGNYKGGEESSYIITGKAWVNNHAHLVKPNEDCDITFLHYYLTISDLSPYVTGTTRQKLTQKSLVSIPVITPPVEEQKAFVSIVLQADKSKYLN